MAKFETALRYSANADKVTLPFLKEGLGKKTVKVKEFFSVPLDETRGNIEQTNFLMSVYRRVWKKIAGDSIISQLAANLIFDAAIKNFPAAQKAIIAFVARKLKIPMTDELTQDTIDKLNVLIDGDNDFAEEFVKLFAFYQLSFFKQKIQQIKNWIDKITA